MLVIGLVEVLNFLNQENGDLGGLNLIFFSSLDALVTVSYQLSHEISAEGKWPA